MTQRDAVFAAIGVLVAFAASALLLAAVLARQGPQGRIIVGRQPVPTAQPIAQLERRLPQEFRFLAPLLPLQRGLSDAGHEAAGLLLVVLATGGALVLAREQVVKIHASSAGDAGDQVRIFGIGIGVLVALASAIFLAVFVLLRGVIGLAPANIPFGLQAIVSTLSLVLLLVGVAALLGFTATAWRIGGWLFGLRPWRSLGERVPAGIETLVTAAVLFVVTQIPVAGPLVAAGLLAYSLGAFVRARLAPAGVAA